MTPTQIGLLILAVVGVIIVGSLVMQGIENQRRERRLRILTLKDQIRRADHLLNSIPMELRSQAADRLLLKYLIDHWRELGHLDPTAQSENQIARLTEMAKQPPTKPMAANGLTLFPNKQQASNAKAVMRELAQFMADLQKLGRFQPQQLQPIINQVKIGYNRANLDVQLFQAQETEQSRGPSVAIHQYRSCSQALDKLARFAPVAPQKQTIENLIMNCEVILEQEREQKEAERAAELEKSKKPGAL